MPLPVMCARMQSSVILLTTVLPVVLPSLTTALVVSQLGWLHDGSKTSSPEAVSLRCFASAPCYTQTPVTQRSLFP